MNSLEEVTMKTALLIAMAFVLLSSLPLLAHQNGARAQQGATTAAPGGRANEPPCANEPVNQGSREASDRVVNAELIGKLDSKSAKVGDTVVAKTKENVKTAGGTIIPRGSRLIGHVAEVQAHDAGHADSTMSIAFERAELKNGQSVAIHALIESGAPPAAPHSDKAIAPSLDGGAMSGGSTGGVTPDLRSGGGSTGTAVGLAGDATSSAGSQLQVSLDAAGSFDAHETAIPGVKLAGDAASSGSGTFSASKKNVHLDSGTQLSLRVSAPLSN
jgi:hypothetical protein